MMTTRLKHLEKRLALITPGPLVLLCRMPDGTERTMSVHEMIDTGSHFQKVVRGNNLADLDRMLQYEFEGIMNGQ